MIYAYRKNELYHHGILGQKWGKRNGPPYPLSGGDYSEEEKQKQKMHYTKSLRSNSTYNKKHFDSTIKKGATLRTLSYDKDRTKNTDMFFAAYDALDKHQYNALFNKPIKDAGEMCFKYKIDNSVVKDAKVASEDSASEIFKNLYKKDRDFYNFITDEDRMQSYFDNARYRFKGYAESKSILDKFKDKSYTPTSEDVSAIYRMFNFVIPYDGKGDSRKADDVVNQRTKFFKACKDAGYSALLDTNDAIYGGFKAKSPVIVFDMDAIVPKEVKRTKISDKTISNVVFVGRKILGI